MDELEKSERPDGGGVKSARRALDLLELLSRVDHGLTFSELQAELGYPKGSLHALLRTLTDARWTQYRSDDKRFVLGPRVWEASNAYARMVPWDERARPVLERVRDLLGETVQLAVLDNFEALYVAKVDGRHLLKLDSSVGQRLEPHATGVGKILLAGLEKERLEQWLSGRHLHRYTDHTFASPQALRAELARIRSRGYATDLEERTIGASCVAVGVSDEGGKVWAAMSVSAPSVRFDSLHNDTTVKMLTEAAQDLTRILGPELRRLSPAGR